MEEPISRLSISYYILVFADVFTRQVGRSKRSGFPVMHHLLMVWCSQIKNRFVYGLDLPRNIRGVGSEATTRPWGPHLQGRWARWVITLILPQDTNNVNAHSAKWEAHQHALHPLRGERAPLCRRRCGGCSVGAVSGQESCFVAGLAITRNTPKNPIRLKNARIIRWISFETILCFTMWLVYFCTTSLCVVLLNTCPQSS